MVKPISLGLLGIAVAVLTSSPTVAAETVSRKSVRQTSSGDVEKVTRDKITLKSRSKTISIPANDIKAVKWSREPPVLNRARNDERANQLEKALAGYEEAKKAAKSARLELKADLDFGIASTTAKLAMAGTGKIETAVGLLEAFGKGHLNSYHFYECQDLLGRLLTKQQEWGNAESAFNLLGESPLQEYKMAAQIGKARILLQKDAGDASAAIAAFDIVIGMKPAGGGEKIRQLDALFGKVDALLATNQYDNALGLAEKVIDDPDIQDESVLARAYLRRGNCFMAMGKPKLAALTFLYVDRLLFKNKSAHAEALFHLSQLWEKLGRSGDADDAGTRLRTLYPESEWTKKLDQ